MALKIKPPMHRADAPGVFISAHDTAWDNEIYQADMVILRGKALGEVQRVAEAAYRADHPSATDDEIAALRASCKLSAAQDAEAISLHPVIRYMRGVTRWQPDAPDFDAEGKPCTVRSRYLKPGAAEFTIRRLQSEAYYTADNIENTGERLKAFARAGLRGVRAGEFTWTAEDADKRAPDHVIEALFECDPGLPMEIGQAVISMRRPMDEAETFR